MNMMSSFVLCRVLFLIAVHMCFVSGGRHRLRSPVDQGLMKPIMPLEQEAIFSPREGSTEGLACHPMCRPRGRLPTNQLVSWSPDKPFGTTPFTSRNGMPLYLGINPTAAATISTYPQRMTGMPYLVPPAKPGKEKNGLLPMVPIDFSGMMAPASLPRYRPLPSSWQSSFIELGSSAPTLLHNNGILTLADGSKFPWLTYNYEWLKGTAHSQHIPYQGDPSPSGSLIGYPPQMATQVHWTPFQMGPPFDPPPGPMIG